jgi:hypothetical protein
MTLEPIPAAGQGREKEGRSHAMLAKCIPAEVQDYHAGAQCLSCLVLRQPVASCHAMHVHVLDSIVLLAALAPAGVSQPAQIELPRLYLHRYLRLY